MKGKTKSKKNVKNKWKNKQWKTEERKKKTEKRQRETNGKHEKRDLINKKGKDTLNFKNEKWQKVK